MTAIEVLLVDDEERYLKTTAKLLKREGFNVTTASSGICALEILQQKTIDVAVLDFRMPGIDGQEVLTTIKQRYPLIEVIILTGEATVDSAVEGLKRGAFAYIVKPADVNELVNKIKSAYSKGLQNK